MNYPFRQFVLAALSICFCFQTFAQKSWEPGYVVASSGDTLMGLILNKDWNKAPESIEFIHRSKKEITAFSAKEILSFGIAGGTQYERLQLNLDVTPIKLEELKYVDQPQYKEGDWLARLVWAGTTSLYYLKDPNSKVHFIVKNEEGILTELIVRKELIRKNGRFYVNDQPLYKGQLRVLTSACPNLEPEINKLSYTERSLGEFMRDYSICINPDLDSLRYIDPNLMSRQSIIVHGYLTGGLSLNRSRLVSAVDVVSSLGWYRGELYPVMNVDFQPHYTLGIGGQFVLPGRHRTGSLIGEIMYRPLRLSGTFSDYYEEPFELDYRLTYIRFNAIGRKEFGKEALRIFVQGGFGFSLLNSRSKDAEIIFPEYRGYEESVLLGVGGRIEKIELEIRGELGSGLSRELDAKSGVTSLYLLAKYQF